MHAFGYVLMAIFGCAFFLLGYKLWKYEQLTRVKAKSAVGQLLGELVRHNPINIRLATIFSAAVLLGINVALAYGFDLTARGVVVAEVIGAAVGFGFYLIVIRPVENIAHKILGQVDEGFQIVETGLKNDIAGSNNGAEVIDVQVVVKPGDNCAPGNATASTVIETTAQPDSDPRSPQA